MNGPADTDPLVALAAAVEHTASGRADEIELEWWADPDGGPERRFTITVRNGIALYNRSRALGGLPAPEKKDQANPPVVAPDDLSGLDDLS